MKQARIMAVTWERQRQERIAIGRICKCGTCECCEELQKEKESQKEKETRR